ncbi:hypothetical protein CAOG_05073 [Capsaspora owczarzaki ATCC 30864]|uniref:Uncharacterized protein n=1 Tax=Capsaspora owczarzaki (strain ATCC 30864) TaxID=595528 RepID=A0A0D2WRC3_CAPO3|nr:hypothetical protein CAOG_05073 [Capsaspora owczarzaki ATCC 30864]KJE94430.1 hypothetical protein CAOG_005073 [Capsaspora owczarzaki ATCC 30864]|eukprot:XP_004346758.2 hypothetical protein CAOG_05073 [Capsaspora owczarzaki ATCC 30864]
MLRSLSSALLKRRRRSTADAMEEAHRRYFDLGNPASALPLYQKAAANGSGEALFMLALYEELSFYDHQQSPANDDDDEGDEGEGDNSHRSNMDVVDASDAARRLLPTLDATAASASTANASAASTVSSQSSTVGAVAVVGAGVVDSAAQSQSTAAASSHSLASTADRPAAAAVASTDREAATDSEAARPTTATTGQDDSASAVGVDTSSHHAQAQAQAPRPKAHAATTPQALEALLCRHRERAAELYAKAAEKQFGPALYMLAWFYRNQLGGLAKNLEKADELQRQANQAGCFDWLLKLSERACVAVGAHVVPDDRAIDVTCQRELVTASATVNSGAVASNKSQVSNLHPTLCSADAGKVKNATQQQVAPTSSNLLAMAAAQLAQAHQLNSPADPQPQAATCLISPEPHAASPSSSSSSSSAAAAATTAHKTQFVCGCVCDCGGFDVDATMIGAAALASPPLSPVRPQGLPESAVVGSEAVGASQRPSSPLDLTLHLHDSNVLPQTTAPSAPVGGPASAIPHTMQRAIRARASSTSAVGSIKRPTSPSPNPMSSPAARIPGQRRVSAGASYSSLAGIALSVIDAHASASSKSGAPSQTGSCSASGNTTPRQRDESPSTTFFASFRRRLSNSFLGSSSSINSSAAFCSTTSSGSAPATTTTTTTTTSTAPPATGRQAVSPTSSLLASAFIPIESRATSPDPLLSPSIFSRASSPEDPTRETPPRLSETFFGESVQQLATAIPSLVQPEPVVATSAAVFPQKASRASWSGVITPASSYPDTASAALPSSLNKTGSPAYHMTSCPQFLQPCTHHQHRLSSATRSRPTAHVQFAPQLASTSRVLSSSLFEDGLSDSEDLQILPPVLPPTARPSMLIHFHLARCFYHGLGVARDANQAMRLYRLAAAEGCVDAINGVGVMHNEGFGVPLDPRLSARLFKRASEGGCAMATYNLAVLHLKGLGVPRDPTLAFNTFLQVAHLSHTELAYLYETGTGTVKNMSEAIKHYTIAAAQGDANAQCNLGVLHGEGVAGVLPPNPTESARLFTLAANQGNANAQCNLARLHQTGIGTFWDLHEAVRLYRLSAAQFHGPALANLGVLFFNGASTVPRDVVEAARLFRIGADRGIGTCLFNYALCLETGKGVKKDRRTAVRYYREAYKKGHNPAGQNLRALLGLDAGDPVP